MRNSCGSALRRLIAGALSCSLRDKRLSCRRVDAGPMAIEFVKSGPYHPGRVDHPGRAELPWDLEPPREGPVRESTRRTRACVATQLVGGDRTHGSRLAARCRTALR